jgi:hypothetical protein
LTLQAFHGRRVAGFSNGLAASLAPLLGLVNRRILVRLCEAQYVKLELHIADLGLR